MDSRHYTLLTLFLIGLWAGGTLFFVQNLPFSNFEPAVSLESKQLENNQSAIVLDTLGKFLRPNEALAANDFNLTVFITGAGTGIVTSSPAGINCPTDCQEIYISNTAVTLSANPSATSDFAGWYGDVPASCNSPTSFNCAMTLVNGTNITKVISVYAVFKVTPAYSLKVYKSGTGSGVVINDANAGGTVLSGGIDCGADCEEAYWDNAVVVLTASSSPNSTFNSWSGCDYTGSLGFYPYLATCTIYMHGDRSVNAVFQNDIGWYQAKLTVSKSGAGTGSVFSNPLGIFCGPNCADFFTSSIPLFTPILKSTNITASRPRFITQTFGNGLLIGEELKLQTSIVSDPVFPTAGTTLNSTTTDLLLTKGFVSGSASYVYGLSIDQIGPAAPPWNNFLDIFGGGPTLLKRIQISQNNYERFTGISKSGNFLYLTHQTNLETTPGPKIYYSGLLEIYDVSNPLNPVKVGQIATANYPEDVSVIGNYAYVVSDWSFQVFDISNPAAPALVGSTNITDGADQKLDVAFPYAYVVNGESASTNNHVLEVIDITKPSAPAVVSSVTIENGLYSIFSPKIKVSGKYAIIAVFHDTWSTSPIPEYNAYFVKFDGYYYIYRRNYLTIYDVSNPIQPRQVGFTNTGQDPSSIDVVGNYVYLTNSGAGLISPYQDTTKAFQIFDITGLGNLTNPIVTLSAEPDDGSNFGAWLGNAPVSCGSFSSCAVTVPLGTEVKINARFDAAGALASPTVDLNVTKSGTGAGRVSNSALNPTTLGSSSLGGGSLGFISSGIDCGADCSETFPVDTGTLLTSIPDAGSDFIKWNGCVVGALMKDDGSFWNAATLSPKKSDGTAAWSVSSDFAAISYQNKLWVLGTGGGIYGQVWSSGDGVTWAQNIPIPNAQGVISWWYARTGHSAITYGGKMWVLGGHIGGGSLTNDVWSSWDGQNWEQNSNAQWSSRQNFPTVKFNGSIWIFGGRANENNSVINKNDVWYSVPAGTGVIWSSATLAVKQSNGTTAWTPRFGHAAVAFNNKLWVLGGNDGGYKKDVWSSADGITWVQETAAAGWSPRGYHKALVFDGKIWVLGGYDGSSYKNDVWSSSDGIIWTQADAAADWQARFGHAATVFNNRMWVLGGTVGTNLYKNDVWYSAAH